ncbi:hypothetical protein N665_3080s0001 [Sinapis alba]|nr:hypothetical protein N665_3080s0001 [Sinapis alba]
MGGGVFQVHAQLLITLWVVIVILLGSAALSVRNPQTIPIGGQIFFEFSPFTFENYPVNDINTTVALSLLTPVAYFYADLSKKGLGYILANELVVVVLVSLVPLVVPIPLMFLGLFTSGIQSLIFSTLVEAYIGESMKGHH